MFIGYSLDQAVRLLQPRDWKSLADNAKRPQALGTLPQPLMRLRAVSR
jgi:hypothetical protein